MRVRDGAVDKEEEKKREPGAVFPNKTIVPKAKKKRPRPTESVAIVVIFFSICFFFCFSTKPKMQSEAIASRWGDAKKAPDQNIKTIEKKKSGQAPLRRWRCENGAKSLKKKTELNQCLFTSW